MALNVLVVPDKFKGTLTAPAAAAAISAGWRAARPADQVTLLPMSDGGDGFGPVLSGLLGAEERRTETVDAAGRPRQASWWWHAPTQTALLESAQVIGLALLPPGRYHPHDLDTFGLGALLLAAVAAGARRSWIGIGGSSTNDAGFGLGRALGWRFLDGTGRPLERWTDLHRLETLQPPDDRAESAERVVAVDVRNPLLGPAGSTRVYGPQKGLRPDQFEPAERCLHRLAAVAGRVTGIDPAEPGAGAAGGLGFGLRAFAGARLAPGFEVFASLANLRAHLEKADVVITGEGAIDESSLMGKGVGEVAGWCRELNVPCIGLAGRTTPAARASGCFQHLAALTPDLAPPAQAQQRAADLLQELARQVAAQMKEPPPSADQRHSWGPSFDEP